MGDWIDITRSLTTGMIQWPGDPLFRCRRFAHRTGPDTSNVSEISTCVHVGTHIEAPLHFVPDGRDIADVPLSQLCGPAVVVDVAADRDIVVEDLKEVDLCKDDRVLFRTVNRKLWEKATFDEHFGGISDEAALWLVAQGVQVVGVDYLSVDGYQAAGYPAHQALLGNGVVIIEGLDLSAIVPGRYEMVALPLKIAGCEASPARVVIRPV